MKAIFFHADRFGFEVKSPSERLGGATPEEVRGMSLDVEECLVVLFHVEESDDERQIRRLCKDIKRIAEKMVVTRLVVAAFGHLSDSYAPPNVAMDISRQVVETCREFGCEVYTSPFGHNKTFVLHAKGHPDAVKYRSY
ncbi:MAG: threonyl-tRNA synthetase editing domain-containing protein [bacterium]|nr:threonyl-tRNA synthetase editing domain-containing protein [bacterium]